MPVGSPPISESGDTACQVRQNPDRVSSRFFESGGMGLRGDNPESPGSQAADLPSLES